MEVRALDVAFDPFSFEGIDKLLIVMMDNSKSSRWALEIAIRERFRPENGDIILLVHVQSCKHVISTSYMGVPIYSNKNPRVFNETEMLLKHYAQSVKNLAFSDRIMLKCLISDLNPADAVKMWLNSESFKQELNGLFGDAEHRVEIIVGRTAYELSDLARAVVKFGEEKEHISDILAQYSPFPCIVVRRDSAYSELIKNAIHMVQNHHSIL